MRSMRLMGRRLLSLPFVVVGWAGLDRQARDLTLELHARLAVVQELDASRLMLIGGGAVVTGLSTLV